jgi:hypothetical protein
MILFRKLDDSRIVMSIIVFSVWALVAIYAIAHDQYIVRIEPAHFTIYHPAVPGVESPALQAAVLAFMASLWPGLALGISLALVCRAGSYPKVGVVYVLIGTAVVIAITELASLMTGLITYLQRKPFYYSSWYPEGAEISLMVTQTIQITCYFVAGLGSFILLCWIMFVRYKWKKT